MCQRVISFIILLSTVFLYDITGSNWSLFCTVILTKLYFSMKNVIQFLYFSIDGEDKSK